MNILKQVLTGVTLAVVIATPMTHTYQKNNGIIPEVILSENPPSLLESAGYVALFLAAAYVLKNMIPPVPPTPEVLPENKACPVIETATFNITYNEVALVETPELDRQASVVDQVEDMTDLSEEISELDMESNLE